MASEERTACNNRDGVPPITRRQQLVSPQVGQQELRALKAEVCPTRAIDGDLPLIALTGLGLAAHARSPR